MHDSEKERRTVRAADLVDRLCRGGRQAIRLSFVAVVVFRWGGLTRPTLPNAFYPPWPVASTALAKANVLASCVPWPSTGPAASAPVAAATAVAVASAWS